MPLVLAGASSYSEVPVVITDVANTLKITSNEVCAELISLKFKEQMKIEYSDLSYVFKLSKRLNNRTLSGIQESFSAKIKSAKERLEAFYRIMEEIKKNGDASEIIEEYFKWCTCNIN